MNPLSRLLPLAPEHSSAPIASMAMIPMRRTTYTCKMTLMMCLNLEALPGMTKDLNLFRMALKIVLERSKGTCGRLRQE
jgi:hypothetical protein